MKYEAIARAAKANSNTEAMHYEQDGTFEVDCMTSTLESLPQIQAMKAGTYKDKA